MTIKAQLASTLRPALAPVVIAPPTFPLLPPPPPALIGGSDMAKKKKEEERDRDDAETRASASVAGPEAGAGPPRR